MNDPAVLGRKYIENCSNRFERGEDDFVFVSVPKLYEKGWYPDFDLIKLYEDKADIVIVYPHYATDEERESFIQLAGQLSKKYDVFLYEAAIEAGGGADTELLQKASFIYQQFQPIFDLGANLAIGVLGSYIYDLIKNLYSNKNNPLLKKQYTIRRTSHGVTFNYVFDGLTADEAIQAGRLIPDEKTQPSASYHDVYLRYVQELNKWIQF